MKTNLTSQDLELHRHHYTSNLPAVYCGTYAKYNCGDLSGMWLDLCSFDTYEEFIEFCTQLHADEHDPELMFQDFENFPSTWYCESCMSEEIFEKILQFADLDQDERNAFCEFIDMRGESATIEDFEEANCGKWDSEEEFAENLMRECYNIPQELENYIDFKKVADELFMFDYEMCGDYVLRKY